MGVDYYTCDYCDDTFPDCGYYVHCESCGTHWCSDECAKEDGFVREHCAIHSDLDNRDLMEKYNKEHCDFNDCVYCEHYRPDSCKYCRHEDYEDHILLDKALSLLNMTREDLITKINKERGEL